MKKRCPTNTETTSTLIFSYLEFHKCKSKTCFVKVLQKSSRGHLHHDFFQKINYFSTFANKEKNGIFMAPCPDPLTNESELQYVLTIVLLSFELF